MNSKTIIAAFCLFAAVHLTQGQSRGEGYHGEQSRTSQNGYNGRNIQTQSQSQYQNSAYPPQYQVQSQSSVYSFPFPPPLPPRPVVAKPEYYPPPPPSQYYNDQSIHQNSYPHVATQHATIPQQQQVYYNSPTKPPAPYQPYNNKPVYASNSQPAQYKPNSPPKNVYQSQQNPNFDTRIDVQTLSDEFPTRPPPPKGVKRPVTTKRPPQPLVNSRFDDRNSASFKKTLSYDSALSDSMEKFSLTVFDAFCVKETDMNFMISPFSIYHLLVLIAEGANGNTFKQISDKLEFGTLARTRDFQQYLSEALKRNTAEVKLNKFAMLVTDRARPIRNEFEIAIEQTYDAIVEPVNFLDVDRTTRYINDQVSKATEGQIIDTVERDDLFKAQLILISGLFFRGSWMNIFNTTFTRQEPFFDTNGNQIGRVNMMFQRGPLAYVAIADIGCHVLELPYAEAPITTRGEVYGSGLSMVVILPRKGLSLSEASQKIYGFTMNKIYKALYESKLEYEDEEVEVHLPRFEITTSFDLKDVLQDLGIKDAFDQSRADLSNINNNYFVSSMIHKTKLSVDERGTTAAAVTTSIFANKATPPKFHANKPFLFFIVDKTTNLILFSGQYTTPELY